MKFLIFTLTLILSFQSEGWAKQEITGCSVVEKMALTSKRAEFIDCVKYFQKKDSNHYIALLELFPDEEEELAMATVSHFYEKNGAYKLLFQDSQLGETFLPITYDGKKKKIFVYDYNKDGRLDISFRSYIVPATKMTIQSFSYKSKKISNIGMYQFYEGETEFSPYFIFDVDSSVVVEDKKITSKQDEKVRLGYLLTGNHFILKINNISPN